MKRLAMNGILAAALLGACATEPGPTDLDDSGGKADQISGRDDPSGLLERAERRLGQLITAQDVGQTFGVDDDRVPYPDTYWPMVDDGIAVKWLESDGSRCSAANECNDGQPSPLEKYMAVLRPADTQEALTWEVDKHGSKVPNVADWFGHCPGWSAAATLNAPIRAPLSVKANGFGGVEPCTAGEAGCTTFAIGDLNALMAEVHEGASSAFIGARCDTKPSEIERDEHGRIVRNGTGCKGLNPGALMIVMGNLLKVEKRPFVIDAQNEANTDQIWNQPAFRYTVHRFESLSEAEAANLVASGGDRRQGDQDEYLWNSNARGFAFVDVALHWVSETAGPNSEMVSGMETARETRMVAVIELDRDPADPEALIIGGEYLDDPQVGANRLRVPPFVWLAFAAGPDSAHNPFVSADRVEELVALALGADAPPPAPSCPHAACAEGAKLAPSCGACEEQVCGEDAFCCANEWDAVCVQLAAARCGCP